MKVENKNNGTTCYAQVNRRGWAITYKSKTTICTEKEFVDNYIILL